MRVAASLVATMLSITPQAAAGQAASPPRDDLRWFLDINIVGASRSNSGDREFSSRFVSAGEIGSTRANYPKPSQAMTFLDAGGGFKITRAAHVGLSISRTTYDDVVGLGATIPHPTVYNAPATNTGVTSAERSRRETAINVFLALASPPIKGIQFRLLGGPSYFFYRADMAQEVLFAQQFDPLLPVNAITINGATNSTVSATGPGFHAGGDVTWPVNDWFGIAAGTRYSWGGVSLDREPLSGLEQTIRVGGTQVFVGGRFAFGR